MYRDGLSDLISIILSALDPSIGSREDIVRVIAHVSEWLCCTEGCSCQIIEIGECGFWPYFAHLIT